jgi:3-oxoacyl-[acyl-carrier-protein] synthase-1
MTLEITAIGMVTALGHDAMTACAASRARLSMASELTTLMFGGDAVFGLEDLDGTPLVSGHAVRGLGDGFTGLAKAQLFGVAALQDLQSRRRLTEAEIERTALCLNLSDSFVEDAHLKQLQDNGHAEDDDRPPSEGYRRRYAELPPRLVENSGLDVSQQHRSVVHGGHAGFAVCLDHAASLLQGGAVERCLIGGIDSRVDPPFVKAAAALNILKTSLNPVGLIPGEAAAFVLVESSGACRSAGIRPLATIGAWTQGQEGAAYFDDAPSTGQALGHTIEAVLDTDAAAREGLAWVLPDLNGTTRRASEWGNTLVRLQQGLAIADYPTWLPAESFGDAGAAAGPLAMCMIARAFERSYAPGRAALATLASERGSRAAVTVRA